MYKKRKEKPSESFNYQTVVIYYYFMFFQFMSYSEVKTVSGICL